MSITVIRYQTVSPEGRVCLQCDLSEEGGGGDPTFGWPRLRGLLSSFFLVGGFLSRGSVNAVPVIQSPPQQKNNSYNK